MSRRRAGAGAGGVKRVPSLARPEDAVSGEKRRAVGREREWPAGNGVVAAAVLLITSGTQRSLVDALCKTRQVVPQDTFKTFHKAHQIPFTKGIKHLSPDIYRKRHRTPFT